MRSMIEMRLLMMLTIVAFGSSTSGFDAQIPNIPGMVLTKGDTIVVPDAISTLAFRFNDGRIVVMGDNQGIWSEDQGKTWTTGIRGPTDKTVIDLGGGEILSISRTTTRKPNGKFRLPQQRSLDNWRPVTAEHSEIDTPLAVPTGGDDGDQHEGMLMHHGVMMLTNGNLMASMYGNYQGDTRLADGYPESFNFRKYRTVVVFSSDKGRTWGDPVTVAYDRMLGRGTDPDSSVHTTAVVPAITQEGFCEADLVRAPNGDILCVMRSGGRISFPAAPVFPTPLYMARSRDEGQTWSAPVQIADRGVNPNLVALDNGVIVCAYARPGSWLIFCDDNDPTWRGAFQIGGSDSYSNILSVGRDKILALYLDDGRVKGTFYTVKKDAE